MPHFGTPAELPSPVVGGEQVQRAPEVPPVTFVGGTGRSGTHVLVAADLAQRALGAGPGRGPLPHRPRRVPRPARRRGHPGAVRQPAARLLVARVSDPPLSRHVPVRRPGAVRRRGRAVRGGIRRRPRAGLPRPLLRPALVPGPRRPQSDGASRSSSRAPTPSPRRRPWCGCSPRRASSTSSATAATPPPRGSRRPAGLVRPRTRAQGIDWWEERIRAIERGADAIPPARLLTVSLDELLLMSGARAALRPIFRFLGGPATKRARRYFNNRMARRAGAQPTAGRRRSRPARRSSSRRCTTRR